jgi:uncharacterized protein with gpF-like domain
MRRTRKRPTQRSQIQRMDINALIAAIIAYFLSDDTTRQFYEKVAPAVTSAIAHEATQAASLLQTEYNSDGIIAEWLVGFKDRLRNVDGVTSSLIEKILRDGYASGKTIDEIASDITELFDLFDRVRALTVARTEILGASNFGAWSVYSWYGVPFKRWVATMDNRVRDTHASANQQVQPIRDPFIIGLDDMMYPGDPNGSAREVINCRCYIIPEWSGDRSVWSNAHIHALWNSYIIRTTPLENQAVVLIKEAFLVQRSAVLAIIKGV